MLSNAGQHRIVLRDVVLPTASKPEHVLVPDLLQLIIGQSTESLFEWACMADPYLILQ